VIGLPSLQAMDRAEHYMDLLEEQIKLLEDKGK
jgi:hypothetical protein